MNDKKKKSEELIKELHELREMHNSLKLLYEKYISEKKQEQKHLRESEAKYRFMFDKNPLPNWIYNPNTFSFLDVNEAAIKHYGYSRQEFLSMTLKNIYSLEDTLHLLEDNKLINSQQDMVSECRHIKKSGELIFVEIASHPVVFVWSRSPDPIPFEKPRRFHVCVAPSTHPDLLEQQAVPV